MPKLVLAAALVALCSLAQAQSASAPAPAPAPAPVTQAKKDLVARVLQVQQPGIEALARNLAQEPVGMLMQQIGPALQSRVAPDKREAVGKEIQADLKKYVDEAVPLMRDKAMKLAPTTIGPMLEEKFTEDELKQLITFLESPVNKKFVQLGGDMQRALVEKLMPEMRSALEPKFKVMEQSVAKRMGMVPPVPTPAASTGSASAPAKAASAQAKPASK